MPNTRSVLLLCDVLCLLVCLSSFGNLAYAQHFPAPDPPVHRQPVLSSTAGMTRGVRPSAAATEWTFHKTTNGQHPDGIEQARLWLINRARQDPVAEGIWLATSQEPDIAGGRDFFGVDVELLQDEFAAIPARPPAAFDVRLYDAARAHAEDLIARDAQDHVGQIERVREAGFAYTLCRLNVFSFADNALNAHAAFNIDWGPGDGTGMQPGRGHRKAIMSSEAGEDLVNVGIASVSDTDPNTQVGPLVMAGNYCNAQEQTNQFNRFIVGTVWEDSNHNARYDPGEGFEGVLVMPDPGDFFAVTSAGGGYAIPITDPGEYAVTFSGSGIGDDVTTTVTVNTASVLLDHLVTTLLTAGDVNGDGSLTPADALLAFQHFLGLAQPPLDTAAQERANVDDPDGSAITPADALCIFRNFLGLTSCLD